MLCAAACHKNHLFRRRREHFFGCGTKHTERGIGENPSSEKVNDCSGCGRESVRRERRMKSGNRENIMKAMSPLSASHLLGFFITILSRWLHRLNIWCRVVEVSCFAVGFVSAGEVGRKMTGSVVIGATESRRPKCFGIFEQEKLCSKCYKLLRCFETLPQLYRNTLASRCAKFSCELDS